MNQPMTNQKTVACSPGFSRSDCHPQMRFAAPMNHSVGTAALLRRLDYCSQAAEHRSPTLGCLDLQHGTRIESRKWDVERSHGFTERSSCN